MYVDSINFLDCQYDGKSAHHVAMIHVMLGTNNITLRLHLGRGRKRAGSNRYLWLARRCQTAIATHARISQRSYD
jgi:hypothetical protein